MMSIKKIISKPVKGLDYSEWETSDLRAWDKIRRRNAGEFTEKDEKTIDRLNRTYGLKKFYMFL